jgi:hypothetical protein
MDILAPTLLPIISRAKVLFHDKGYLKGLEAASVALVQIINDYEVARDTIKGDVDLTIQAKQKRIGDLRKIAQDRIDGVRDNQARLQQLEVRIFASRPKGSDVEELTRYQKLHEIRDDIKAKKLDPLRIVELLYAALNNGDNLLIDSISEDPAAGYDPLVQKDAIQDVLQKRAFSRISTDVAEEYQDVKLLNGSIAGMRHVAKTHLID